MKKLITEVVGWYGASAILLAYVLVSFAYVSPESITYQVLNATGAAGIIIVSLYKKNYQPAVLNIVWATIAIVAVLSLI